MIKEINVINFNPFLFLKWETKNEKCSLYNYIYFLCSTDPENDACAVVCANPDPDQAKPEDSCVAAVDSCDPGQGGPPSCPRCEPDQANQETSCVAAVGSCEPGQVEPPSCSRCEPDKANQETSCVAAVGSCEPGQVEPHCCAAVKSCESCCKPGQVAPHCGAAADSCQHKEEQTGIRRAIISPCQEHITFLQI
jgi:hypothetical protein